MPKILLVTPGISSEEMEDLKIAENGSVCFSHNGNRFTAMPKQAFGSYIVIDGNDISEIINLECEASLISKSNHKTRN